jgi:hypothetical protein
LSQAASSESLALSFLLLAVAAPAAAEGPAGRYRLTGEQDVASQLVLHRDGRFDYRLAAGALDERSRGYWRRVGKEVRLTTEPKPVPPVFALQDETRGAGPFRVRVVWPDGRGIAGVDLRVGFDRGEAVAGYTQEEGWSLPAHEARTPRWVELAVAMHGLASLRFDVDVARANALTFQLVPNDLGLVDFQDLRLDVGRGRLVMHRHGGRLVYVRVRD